MQQLESWSIDKFIAYASNPRKNDHAVDRIAAAIHEFGFRVPIIAKSDGTVVDGHLRLKAAKKLNLQEVPVLIADDMTEVQIKAFRLSVNRVAEIAEWDFELLKIELEGLQDADFDLSLLGFDDDELAKLLGEEEGTEGLTDEDAVPELQNDPVTVEGDVWVLGNHRLMCGDSTSIDAVEKLMAGQKADMVFTDPPYGMHLDADYSKMGSDKIKAGKKHANIIGDFEDFDPSLIFGVFGYCNDIVIFGADYFADMLLDRNQGSWLVWDKRVEDRYETIIGSAFELIWTKRKVKRSIVRHEYVSWASRMADKVNGVKPHPTMKPVEMLVMVMDKFDQREGDITVDLYGGSGSTLIACEKTARHARLMELDPKYCDVIIKRWQDFTGKEAVHEATGATYASMVK